MGWSAGQGRQGTMKRAASLAAVLDIGTSKVVCLIGSLAPPVAPGGTAEVRVLGVGHVRSRGMKSGLVVDFDAAEAQVRAAIAQAERMARLSVDEVSVSVSCGRLVSQAFKASAEIASGLVVRHDMQRLNDGARAYAVRDGRLLLHLNDTGFGLDGASGIANPAGMAGRTLTAGFHAVTADDGPVLNLTHVIERCHLAVSRRVLGPYASALAVTSEEERRLGVTVVDIGAGTTTFARFTGGALVLAGAIPVGSGHITFDIARCLQTPLAEAERIKTLYGTLAPAPSDAHEVFSYPLSGEEEGGTGDITKAQLAGIVLSRMKGLMDLVRERIGTGIADGATPDQVVITGGGSQLTGLQVFAAAELGLTVRIGRPAGLSGLPHAASSPAFAATAGVILALAHDDGAAEAAGGEQPVGGYFGRVGAWLKSGF